MSRFDTTRWSLVLKARGDSSEARAALDVLCRTCRPAVLAYVRSRGYPADAAEDLTQGFFLKFIDQAWHAGADSGRGRFRAYLLTMLRRHLVRAEREAHALKRGGGAFLEPFDEANATAAGDDTPERSFERAWAITVLSHALARLRGEADQVGKRPLFDALRQFLMDRPDETEYTRVAQELGMRVNTLAVAVHRLRHRLRELVEAELADTTSSHDDLETELHDLHGAFEFGASRVLDDPTADHDPEH